jgi:hypothetical protein
VDERSVIRDPTQRRSFSAGYAPLTRPTLAQLTAAMGGGERAEMILATSGLQAVPAQGGSAERCNQS